MINRPFNQFLTVVTVASGLFVVGCLPTSPLFNHANADPFKGLQLEKPKGCALVFPGEGLCASLSWTKEPTDSEKGLFTLRFWKQDQSTEAGPYLSPTNAVAVKLWMPDMGHGSSPVKVVQSVDSLNVPVPGVFEASDIYFVMGGQWEIWIQLKKDKQVIEQAKIDYQF